MEELLCSHFSSLNYFIWKCCQNNPWQILHSAISGGFNYVIESPPNTQMILFQHLKKSMCNNRKSWTSFI